MGMTALFCFFLVFAVLAVAPAALPQESFINEIEFAPYIIMPEELLYRVAAGEGTYLIVDIRQADRFSKGHVRGAIRLEWPHEKTDSAESNERSPGLSEPLKTMFSSDTDLYIIDEAGNESFELLRYLLERGCSRVRVVEGGMKNWPYREYMETGGGE
ncbi:MAG: rhodanese-like domain-containing protein [Spirochaetes bacterium]|nr:rhodanese-like domain-containing protein [Spirochaetota bacterium]